MVLSVAAGALRGYLEAQEELPDSSLLAMVPVSVRDVSKGSGGANKVPALFTKLGTDIADPLDRLAERNRHAKEHHNAISADALQDWAEFAAPRRDQFVMTSYYRDDIGIPEMGVVGRELWKQSGLTPDDVPMAILYDHFTPYVLMPLEELGFCGRARRRTSSRTVPSRAAAGCPSTPTAASSEGPTSTA